MRNEPNLKLERYRHGGPPHINAGWFVIVRPEGNLRLIVSNGSGWDHVSVSLSHRCPAWDEMCLVKELCFRDDEVAMQLHPAKRDYVNNHQFCLHLWRPQTADEVSVIKRAWESSGEEYPVPAQLPGAIPLPPAWTVGVQGAELISQ